MKKNDMEKKIKKAFTAETPDILDAVIRDCSDGKGVMKEMQGKKNRRSAVGWIAAAACAVLLLTGVGFYGYYDANWVPVSRVVLDVNPSVEISLSKNGRVLSVRPLNEDGEQIIGEMDFRNSDLKGTVSVLVGSMVQNGYLSDMANSILISVDGQKYEKSEEIQKEISEQIDELMTQEGLDAAVLSQVIIDEAAEELADAYEISLGKAQLIGAIAAAAPRYSLEELATMTVNELNLLAEKENVSLGSLDSTGEASRKGFITPEQAREAALSHLGLTQVQDMGTELEMEQGRMVYEIEFCYAEQEYEVSVDARTGEPVRTETEKKDGRIPDGEYIGRDRATDAALKHAALNSDQVENLECELENEAGKILYEVEFDTDTGSLKIAVDAVTGSVLDVQTEEEDRDQEDEEEDDDEIPEGTYISRQKAQASALSHAGLEAEKVRDLTCEPEVSGKTVYYDVEFETAEFEYEYKIDAITGTVLKAEKEIS